MGKYVGIDLGTTISAIAYIDDNGQPQLIPNKNGERLIPSAVLFGGKKPIVGERAKTKSVSDPKNYESFVKRHMGDKDYTFTDKSGETYNAETVSSIILSQLKENAEEFLGEKISGAVITVPAYFGDSQRQATRDAARLAGIPVLDIINEPTAAAIAFGTSKNIGDKQKILVFDFGGGTFDISILDIDNSNIKVIVTNGDHQLGGYNIDKILAEYISEEAKDAGFDVDNDIKARQQIMIAAEKAKKDISFSETADITIFVKGEEFELELDREYFDELIYEIINRTINLMQSTMTKANLKYNDIDKILLVGGSTRIPQVRSKIEECSGIKPSSEVHPDEAVAIGAAFHSIDVARKKADGTFNSGMPDELVQEDEKIDIDTGSIPNIEKQYTFQDVISHGIGVIAYSPHDNKDYNSIIMKANTAIPATVTDDNYAAQAGTDSIHVQITQGDSKDLNYVKVIGEAVMKIRPRNYNVRLSVSVTCTTDGIIHVHATDLDRGENGDEVVPLGEIQINREKFNMTEEEFHEAENKLHKLNIGD